MEKTKNIVNRGQWRNGEFVGNHKPAEEADLKIVEKTANEYADMAYDDSSYKVAIIPPSSQRKDIDIAANATENKDIVKPSNENTTKILKKVEIDKNESKVDKPSKDKGKDKKTSKSKDVKKKVKKADVDEDDD